MTYYDLLKIEHPECCISEGIKVKAKGCPKDYGYTPKDEECLLNENFLYSSCTDCWLREIPEDSPIFAEKKSEEKPGGDIPSALREIQKQIGKIIEIMGGER